MEKYTTLIEKKIDDPQKLKVIKKDVETIINIAVETDNIMRSQKTKLLTTLNKLPDTIEDIELYAKKTILSNLFCVVFEILNIFKNGTCAKSYLNEKMHRVLYYLFKENLLDDFVLSSVLLDFQTDLEE